MLLSSSQTINRAAARLCTASRPKRARAQDLLAHDLLELALAQPTLPVAQLPVVRDAEEVGV